MRAVFVTNLCPHYLVGTFEALARKLDVEFLFHSDGSEWYHGQVIRPHGGAFRHTYLPGFTLRRGLRITPSLVPRILNGGYDVVISGIDGKFPLAATLATARLGRLPFVLWTGIWKHPESFVHRITFPITRAIYRHADALVTYGDHVSGYLADLGADRTRMFPAYQAVDNATFAAPQDPERRAALARSLGLPDGVPVVLAVGRLTAIKGFDVLIDAAARTGRDVVVLIAGQGEDRAALEERARRQNVRAVFADRTIPNTEMPLYYALADIVAVTSVSQPEGKEAWGFVVNEAMNQGKPIVSSDAVGSVMSGLVRHGEEGLVVPERDADALGRALATLLADPALARRMGDSGRARVATFTQDRMAQAFVDAAECAVRYRR